MPSGNKIISSIPLQVLIYFNSWYALLYYVLNFILFIYKSLALPYPGSYLAGEVIGLVLMLLVDLMRLPLGNRGNKTEQAGPTVLFLILSLGLGIGCAYYIVLETFVLL